MVHSGHGQSMTERVTRVSSYGARGNKHWTGIQTMVRAFHNDQRPSSVISPSSWKASTWLNWRLSQWKLPGKRGDTPQKSKEYGLGDTRQVHPLTMNLRMPVRACKPNYPDFCTYLCASPSALPQDVRDLAHWAEGLRGNFLHTQLNQLEGNPPGREHRGQQW